MLVMVLRIWCVFGLIASLGGFCGVGGLSVGGRMLAGDGRYIHSSILLFLAVGSFFAARWLKGELDGKGTER